MTARRVKETESGVSTVLGAVLMFGLLVLTLTVIQVEFVPVWDEDREARHMQALSDDLRQLKSDLDRQASNATANVLTDPLELKREGGFRFFQGGGNLGADAGFTPAAAGTGLRVLTDNPVQVLQRDGQSLFGLSPDWDPYVPDEQNDVGAVSYLVLRVQVSTGSQCGDGEGTATLNIYDAADDLVGSVHTQIVDPGSGSDCYVRLRTYDGTVLTSNELHAETEAFFQNVGSPYYVYFDLLAPERKVLSLLAQATTPLRLEFIQGAPPLAASYQISYTAASTGGVTGSAGVPEANYDSGLLASGRVEIDAQNQRFVDQTYVLEHGALVLVQQEGAAMAAPPAFGVLHSAAQTALSWSIPGLTGSQETLSGDRASAVAAPLPGASEVSLLASELSFTIPTEHHAAWATYLTSLFADAGMVPGEYTIGSDNGAYVQVDIEGPVNDNVALDVALDLRFSPIALALTPG